MELSQEYSDLRFTREQLFLSAEEAMMVIKDFWGGTSLGTEEVTDIDRAFIQAALMVAVDKSEKAGLLFDVYSSFVKAAPSQSLKKLAVSLAKRMAKRWFRNYIDDDPKVSAVGKAAVQYSAFTTEWKVRVGTGDVTFLTNFLVS